MPRRLRAAASLTIALIIPSLPASAQGQPGPNAVPATEQEVKSLMEGKSWSWNAGGGAYWGKGGVFRGWTVNKGEEIWGEGTWTATGGNLCYDVVWNSKTEKLPVKRCWQFVKGPSTDGKYKLVYWSKADRGDGVGWVRRDKEFDARYQAGDKFGAKVAELKKKS